MTRGQVRSVWMLVLVGTMLACAKSGDVRRVASTEGEVLTVKGKYTLIILSQDTMRRVFGSEWHQHSIFYRSNRAITQDGERSAIAPSPLRPLAKGAPILVISGDDWPDLLVHMYELETRKQATFAIDTVKGTISVPGPAELRPGEPMFSPDGHLFFR
jgi:hypothetical protein